MVLTEAEAGSDLGALTTTAVKNDDGSLGNTNDVVCTGVEEKMGLHGSPTCQMAFGSKGNCNEVKQLIARAKETPELTDSAEQLEIVVDRLAEVAMQIGYILAQVQRFFCSDCAHLEPSFYTGTRQIAPAADNDIL